MTDLSSSTPDTALRHALRPGPRDLQRAHHVGLVRVARVISDVLSPPFVLGLLGLALPLHEGVTAQALLWGASFALVSCVIPMAMLVYAVRSGRISELHMGRTSERHLAYAAAAAGGLGYAALVGWLDGPHVLWCFSSAVALSFAGLGLVNTRWLVSNHASTAMLAFLSAALVFGRQVAVPWLLILLILVCLGRLFLRRHDLAQIVAGLLIGSAAVGLMHWLARFP